VPVPPAELTAELTLEGPDEARAAAREAAGASGIGLDAGPGQTMLSGSRSAVLSALDAVVRAALEAGAHQLDVRLEAPTADVRPPSGR
jgi:hypothetical protein